MGVHPKYHHTIIWICPSVCLSANYSAVFGPIDPKLGRNVGDSTEQNLRALVSMGMVFNKNCPVALILGGW